MIRKHIVEPFYRQVVVTELDNREAVLSSAKSRTKYGYELERMIASSYRASGCFGNEIKLSIRETDDREVLLYSKYFYLLLNRLTSKK